MKKIIVIAFSLLSLQAWAGELDLKLKEGVGRDIVATQCAACHSVDMIQINSPFMTKKEWEATVNKMVNVMGSPLAKEDIPTVVEYLTKYYGK
jgi:mono/diheme cytochrome c family protein